MKHQFANILRDIFHPHEIFRILGKDRYTSLKIRIVLLDICLSMIPLFIVITISYFWFQKILKDDFYKQVNWEIQNTKQTIEFFIDGRISALRFIAASYSYEQLSEPETLTDVFQKFKREFGGLVDFGVIDSTGMQKSYSGPYKLKGKDYSEQEWFHEVMVRSYYVSEVFLGYRNIPHFAIAVKSEASGKRPFWILRATINIDTLQKYVTAVNQRPTDDIFVISREGILQTPSKIGGDVLRQYPYDFEFPRQGISIDEIKTKDGIYRIWGLAPIQQTPWILISDIRSTPYTKIPSIFRNEIFFITVFSILLGTIFTIIMANMVVNRIRLSDIEREEAISQSEHAGKMASIGRLAAGVAHEINNPLAIINEKAGLMKDLLERSENMGQQKDKFLALIHGISDSVTRCRTITHRLLGFSRRMEISQDAIDINDAIQEVVGFLEKEILYREIKLELELQKDLPKVITDRGQVQQVFLNIINNSVDAVKEHGNIKISTYLKNDHHVRVAIKDNGSGIPKETLKHIFEPFYSTKEKGKGTGLGLSISYGIMQKLGGSILVESAINMGTTFIVEIPINILDIKKGGS